MMGSVKVKRVRPGAELPRYMTEGAAGADLYACLSETIELLPGRRAEVPTGIAVELPPGYEAQIRPRSGLARKHGLTLMNSPGTIDSDYRGEIIVLLVNLGQTPFALRSGERIAQMVVAPVVHVSFAWAEDLVKTDRGHGGFGHTG